jgi:hypothetical protein
MVIGLAAAIPALVVLGALLASADPLFGRMMERVLFLRLGGWEDHLVVAGIFGWFGVGLLRGGFWREGRGEPLAVTRPELASASVMAFVGAIGGLLLLFVLFQVGELFIGAESFQRVMGLTIAEYARHGFFELAWVVGLTLPLLLAADWCLDRRQPRAVAWFHRLAGAVTGLLLLVLASAFHRMTLYESLYGLTELRFYTLVFMGWLAGVLPWFAGTVLRGRRSRFVPGTLVAAYSVVLALNVANPDRIIAVLNLRRIGTHSSVDVSYLVTLSADAVPALVKAASSLPPADQCVVLRGLLDRWGNAEGHTGPTSEWNLSRLEAFSAVEGLGWLAAECPVPPAEPPQGTDARL